MEGMEGMEGMKVMGTMENKDAQEVKKYNWLGYVIKGGQYLKGYIEPSPYIFKRQDSWNQFIESLKIDVQDTWYKSIIAEEVEKQDKFQKYIEENVYMQCLAKEINKARDKIIDSKKRADGFVKARNAIHASQNDHLAYVDGLFKAKILRT